MYDVIVVGAGVTGSAIARELSRFEWNVAVLEKAEDVCCGTSKANSGIVHAGFDAKPGTLKARLNLEGSRRMEKLAELLDVPYRRNGSLVLCFARAEIEKLEELKERGERNGVEGLRILASEELHKMEPNISKEAVAALYAPTGAIICPFELNIAMAENACVNGVEFHFDTEVETVTGTGQGYELRTRDGRVFRTHTVVNAAGVYADVLHNMVSQRKLRQTARKGEYCLFDRSAGTIVNHTIFQLPTDLGKGVLVTPTVHGNLMIGPTAEDIEDPEDTSTSAQGLEMVLRKASSSLQEVPRGQVITSFAGLRAHEEGGDFVIGEAQDAPGFFDAAGIESPGLSCAPAIGELIAELVRKRWEQEGKAPEKKRIFQETRKGIPCLDNIDPGQLRQLLERDPAYGNVICRCETVTEGQILDAIHRPLGAKTLDGIKRRTRAGMGRCQSGFCSVRVMEILSRELRLPQEELCKSGKASLLLKGGIGA